MLRTDITLGILAGGRAERLGGRDKAWLERDGQPQISRWVRRFAPEVAGVLVSANRAFERYAALGLRALPDPDGAAPGPLAGLETLAWACPTSWLFTLPVDLLETPDDLLPGLIAAADDRGAVAEDTDGLQPLVALYRVQALRAAVGAQLIAGDYAVHRLQAALGLPRARFTAAGFGNLNTPHDLEAAGIAPR